MSDSFTDYIDKTNSATTSGQLLDVFLSSVKAHGLDRMIMCFDTDHAHIGHKVGIGIVENFQSDYLDYYRERNYHEIDPVLTYSRINPYPFMWQDIVFTKMRLNKAQKTVIHEAIDSGLHCGMYIPISRGQYHAGIGPASSLERDNFSGNFDLIRAYCSQFYDAFTRLHADQKQTADTLVLTPKERKILALAAEGQRDCEIAHRLQISANTVETHFKNIFVKLSVSSRTAAVAKALSSRLIAPGWKI